MCLIGRKVRFSGPWGMEEGIVEDDKDGMLDIVTSDDTLFVLNRSEVKLLNIVDTLSTMSVLDLFVLNRSEVKLLRIDISGPDGNAFAIMGVVKRYLKETDQADQVAAFLEEAMSGDYDHLLEVSLKYHPNLEFEGL